MALQQGVGQGRVAQRAAVVAPPVATVAGFGDAFGDGRGGAAFVAHQFEGDAELDQGQAGVGLGAQFVELAQGGQRGLGFPRQHVGAVGKHAEAAVAGVVAVLPDGVFVVDRLGRGQTGNAFLQRAQQEIGGLLLHLDRHREALFAGVEQEVGDVGRQPVFVVGDIAPQAETAVGRLHGTQPGDGLFEHFGALFAGEGLEAEAAGGVFIDEHVGVGGAGGLLGAAVGIDQ